MIYIGAGLPRSGTSLLMQIFEAGGIDVLRDDKYFYPNIHNPKGFYELQEVYNYTANVENCRRMCGSNQGIKVFSLGHFPWKVRQWCSIVWIDRDIDCMMKSYNHMHTIDIPRWIKYPGAGILKDKVTVENQLNKEKRELTTFYEYMIVQYERLVQLPNRIIPEIANFLKFPNFNVDAAIKVVDPSLWRNR